MTLQWESKTKTLTIEYNGTTTTITSPTSYKTSAVTIYVEDGYLTVPNSCFGGFTKLENLYLPDSINNCKIQMIWIDSKSFNIICIIKRLISTYIKKIKRYV